MILVTPFVPGSADYGVLASAMNRRGPQRRHAHVVLSRECDGEEAAEFGSSVSALFSKSVGRAVPDAESDTVRKRENALFRSACRFLASYEPLDGEAPGVPMLYYDQGWLPSGGQWLDRVQGEYYASQAPGALGKWKDVDGVMRLWGPLVVGQSYARASALIDFLPDRVHWRHYLRHEIGRVMVESSTMGSANSAAIRPDYKNRKAKA